MDTARALETGMINAAEAAFCRLLVANIAEFNEITVDAETLMDIRYGSGGYGSTDYFYTLKLICEDYDWCFYRKDKTDPETGYVYKTWTIYQRKTN